MNREYYILFCNWYSQQYHFVCQEVLDWLYCLAHLETGNFSSSVFKDNNNLFGMKLAKARLTTANGVNRNHASYFNCIDSIDDLMFWFCYNRFYQTDFLDVRTFVDKFRKTHYNPKMDSYVSTINQMFIKFFAYDGAI